MSSPVAAWSEGPAVGDGVAGSADALRQVMGNFASGVTVVAAWWRGQAHAMTATAVTSVSLDPPLLLVCVGRASRFHAAITEADGWAVSVLGADQEWVARHFADRGRDLATQFDGVPHADGRLTGAPLVTDAVAWAECRTYARHAGGDHTLVIGEVVAASHDQHRPVPDRAMPLLYHRGRYAAGPVDPGPLEAGDLGTGEVEP